MDTSILYPSYVEQSIRKSDGAVCTWVKAYAVLPKHEIVNYSSCLLYTSPSPRD